MQSAPRASIVFIGSRTSAHPTFLQAMESGITTKWVASPEIARQTISRASFQDLIVFDTKMLSEAQCVLCRQLRRQHQRVVCITHDPKSARDCEWCSTSDRDLLSVMLFAAQNGGGAQSKRE